MIERVSNEVFENRHLPSDSLPIPLDGRARHLIQDVSLLAEQESMLDSQLATMKIGLMLPTSASQKVENHDEHKEKEENDIRGSQPRH